MEQKGKGREDKRRKRKREEGKRGMRGLDTIHIKHVAQCLAHNSRLINDSYYLLYVLFCQDFFISISH